MQSLLKAGYRLVQNNNESLVWLTDITTTTGRRAASATRLNLSEYHIQHTEWVNSAKRRGGFRFTPHPIVKEIVDNMLPKILSGELSPQRALAVFNLE